MSETIKLVFSMCMVGLALAALIVNSIGNLRADLRVIHTETIDIGKKIGDNRIEIAKNRMEINGLRKDMDGLRTDMDGLRTDMDGLRTEMDSFRIEMDRFGQALQALTERVTHLEELVQGVFLPRQGATAKTD